MHNNSYLDNLRLCAMGLSFYCYFLKSYKNKYAVTWDKYPLDQDGLFCSLMMLMKTRTGDRNDQDERFATLNQCWHTLIITGAGSQGSLKQSHTAHCLRTLQSLKDKRTLVKSSLHNNGGENNKQKESLFNTIVDLRKY